MATPEDKLRSLRQTKKLLEELCDPGKTPRVPSIVRDRARTILRTYPNEQDFASMVQDSPETLAKVSNSDTVII